jgi:hypothetical protein
MKKTLILFVSIFIFFSCSNPSEKEFNKDTIKTDLDNLVKDKEIDTLSRKEILLYIWARQETFSIPKKTTYKEIINDFYNYKKCKDLSCLALKTRVEKIRIEEHQFDLLEKVNIAVIEKGFYQTFEKEPFISYKIGVINKVKKDIKGLKGTMIIKDQFDELLLASEITLTELKVLDEKTYTSDWLIPYNSSDEKEEKIYNSKLEDLNISFKLEKILYKDRSFD